LVLVPDGVVVPEATKVSSATGSCAQAVLLRSVRRRKRNHSVRWICAILSLHIEPAKLVNIVDVR
jgi:3-polyprenyl-4-hydroxybenzoate decarboxylase